MEAGHVLVFELSAISGIEIGGERGEAKGRKERVLDRTEEWAGGLGQRRQDELDAQRAAHARTAAASAAGAPVSAPNLRSRAVKAARARRNSRAPKAGQGTRVNQSSA